MDNYDNFIFYGSWRKVLEGIASSQGEDYAKEVLWNIMLMSTAGDVETYQFHRRRNITCG